MDHKQHLPAAPAAAATTTAAAPKRKSSVLSQDYPKTAEGLLQLEADCKKLGYQALAERYGVSHSAVRKYETRLRAALAKAPATAAALEPQNPVSAEPQNGIRPFLTRAQWGEIAAWCKEQDDDGDDGRGVVLISRGDWEASHPAESVDEAPPAGLEPAPGFERLSPREQLTQHLDYLGLAEDGTEIVVDLAPTEGGGHWMRLVTVQRDLEATDSAVFLDVQDVLLTRARRNNNEEPSGKRLGTHNWLFEAASTGAKDYQNKRFEVFFKPNQFVGRGHTVEAENVLATRAFVAESDGGSMHEQWNRAMLLEGLGLRFNVLLDSGGKSLHHFIQAPKDMSVDWARDERINKKLCVCINGDPRVINRDRSMRLAGFERQGGRRQALLKGTADELYASVEELESMLDRVLLEIGISDWEAAFAEIAAEQIKCEQHRQVTAHNGSELGYQWAAWEEAGGWSEGERRAAAAFGGITLTVDNLVGLMPKRATDLVMVGSETGCRNEDGLYLTLELRGVVDVLTDLPVPGVEQLAKAVLERFIEASGGDVDKDRLFAQYDGAEGAMPGRPVANFMHSLHWETGGQLGKRKPKASVLAGSTPLGQLLEAIGPGQWTENEQGQPVRPPKIDVGQFAEMVEALGPALRWNDLTQQVEYNGETLRPEEVELLYVDLNKQDRFVTQKTAIDVVVHRSRVHRYDPVREYLEYLESAADVEPVDLGTLATTYLGTDDPLYDRMLQVMVLGAVSRRFEPGCKFDYVVVLKGEQGIRKSTFWQALASPDWYTTSVPDDDKDLLLTVHSTWIFELAELESVTGKRSVGKLKNIITTSSDLLRVPYGKTTERCSRSSIFVSTVNGDAFLRDETGERRYYVIECPQDPAQGGYIDVEPVVRDRDRIWKAAVLAYRAGQKPYLEHELQHESDVRNEEYQVEDPWGPLLDDWLNPTEHVSQWVEHHTDEWKRGAPEQFDTRQALLGSGVRDEKNLAKPDEMRMANLLKKRGYVNTQRNVGGRKRRLWRKAEAVT